MSPTFDQIAPTLETLSTREIGVLIHRLFPDDDPGMNRARCDHLLNLLGRELPDDWWSLMTHGRLCDADFPARFAPHNLLNLFRIGPSLVATSL